MQNAKNYLIYMHISPNGKGYVGMTCQKEDTRWKNGLGYFNNGQKKFANAIKKYGWKNFKHIILEREISTLELANEREKYWIAYYDTFQNGYNSTIGGDGCYHHRVTEETRRKIGNANKGRVAWNKGIPCSEEAKKHLSEVNKGKPSYVRTEEHKEMMCQLHLGHKVTEETRRKISEHNKGKTGYWLGHKRSEETKKKISESVKKNPNRYWLGKKRSPETIEKMRKKLIGRKKTKKYE